MPHCIVEHSSELDAATLVKAVHQGAIQSELFDCAAIKTRAISYQHHCGDDAFKHFVHVNLKILSGRTEQQKAKLSNIVLEQLKALNLSRISLTVEVSDLHRESYAKAVIG